MKDYDIVITIGASGFNEDMAMDNVNHVLRYVQTHLSNQEYKIEICERGEYL